MQAFFTASMVVPEIGRRGSIWSNVRFDLYKVAGGHQMTDEEYQALIFGWDREHSGPWSDTKDRLDKSLFTYDEVITLRDHFWQVAPNIEFIADLLLKYPIDYLEPCHEIDPADILTKPFSIDSGRLRFDVAGFCDRGSWASILMRQSLRTITAGCGQRSITWI